MNIHEYQAKELFDQFSVPSPKGRVAETAEQAQQIAEELSGQVVIKAQIHAGGRGKGNKTGSYSVKGYPKGGTNNYGSSSGNGPVQAWQNAFDQAFNLFGGIELI